MPMITDKAKQRIAHKSFQEQLEDARRQMQRESGADDMRTINAHLNHDNWQTRCTRIVMPVDGAD